MEETNEEFVWRRTKELMPKWAAIAERAREAIAYWTREFEKLAPIIFELDQYLREEEEYLANWENEGGAVARGGPVC
jgi:hypothetical protein